MTDLIHHLLSVLTKHPVAIGGAVTGIIVLVIFLKRPRSRVRKWGAAHAAPRTDRNTANILENERTRYQAIIDDLKDDNKRLTDDVAHFAQRTDILAKMVKELNSNVDPDRLGSLVLRILERFFRPDQALVFLYDEAKGVLRLEASLGFPAGDDGLELELGEGFAGLVATKKVTMIRQSLESESNLVRQRFEETEPIGLRTDIATPILHEGETVGVLCMGGLSASTMETVESVFGMVGDMASMARKNCLQYRQIQGMANTDPLTALFNKGHFLRVAEKAFYEARKVGQSLSLAILDLDNFKHYNDTNGHLAGDRLLKRLAVLLEREVRDIDAVARFGGEEFVVLFRGVGPVGALQAAERIRQAIADESFEFRERQPLGRVSASIGVASYPEQGRHLEQILEAADASLYAAKNAGRDRVASASDQVEVISA
jgi:diguanylate cyclase (GGDEF)-like protein